MLRRIHKSHLGIAKCRQRARKVLFWPGILVDVEQMVTNCSVCADFAKKQPSEPLKPAIPPSLPWKKMGTDLFEFHGEHYLLSVCYLSKFPEVTKMKSLRSSAVVEELKRQFGIHGIPAVNPKNLQKSMALSTSPVRRITQRPMERRREPFKLSRICGKRTMTNTWPC